jgi:hypothetical protein
LFLAVNFGLIRDSRSTPKLYPSLASITILLLVILDYQLAAFAGLLP